MEVPVLSRISGFEAELTRLQNPSLIPRFLNLSPIKVQSFWTWGALILALLAYFSSFVTRIKYVILRLRKGTSVISQPLLQQLYLDDSDDETCSSSYSSEDESSDEEQEEDEEDYEYEEDQRLINEDFRVAGSGNYEETLGQRRSFSWSDFMNGKRVVKSWDDISMPSPAVLVSAGLETSRNVALRVFDTRVGRQIPQMFAEWQQPYRLHKFPGILNNSEDDVSDDEDVKVRSVVVRDLRKIKSPLENLTDIDYKTWFDADAVIVNGDCSLGNGCGSVVSRCRDAVFSYLF